MAACQHCNKEHSSDHATTRPRGTFHVATELRQYAAMYSRTFLSIINNGVGQHIPAHTPMKVHASELESARQHCRFASRAFLRPVYVCAPSVAYPPPVLLLLGLSKSSDVQSIIGRGSFSVLQHFFAAEVTCWALRIVAVPLPRRTPGRTATRLAAVVGAFA